MGYLPFHSETPSAPTTQVQQGKDAGQGLAFVAPSYHVPKIANPRVSAQVHQAHPPYPHEVRYLPTER